MSTHLDNAERQTSNGERSVHLGQNAGAREPAILITGGAGFIGSNLADRLLRDGHRVLLFDNLSRAGVLRNLEWLLQAHPRDLNVMVADVRDTEAIRRAVARSC